MDLPASTECTPLNHGQSTNSSRITRTGDGNANSTSKRRYGTRGSPYIIFDQDRCRHEIARMIIMHDYPLHMVKHPGFVAFVQNLLSP